MSQLYDQYKAFAEGVGVPVKTQDEFDTWWAAVPDDRRRFLERQWAKGAEHAKKEGFHADGN